MNLSPRLKKLFFELEGKTVLLTGSTGLIGSYIVECIAAYNDLAGSRINLIAINRSENSCRKRFPDFSSKNITFMYCGAEGIFNESLPEKIDYIIHAGSNADPLSFSRNPVETITANVNGTTALLELAKLHNSRFLFVSSREVYGLIKESRNYKEEEFGLCNFNMVRSSYPESKRVAEVLCRSYKDEYAVDSVIARLGYVYGETQTNSDSRAVAQFLRNAVNDEDIVLKSAGLQRRSYTYVADCVSALFTILLYGREDVYNVSNEDAEVSLYELASLIADFAGTKVVRKELSEEELKGSSAFQDALIDCSKLISLGWKPEYGIREGIQRSVSLLKNKINAK